MPARHRSGGLRARLAICPTAPRSFRVGAASVFEPMSRVQKGTSDVTQVEPDALLDRPRGGSAPFRVGARETRPALGPAPGGGARVGRAGARDAGRAGGTGAG